MNDQTNRSLAHDRAGTQITTPTPGPMNNFRRGAKILAVTTVASLLLAACATVKAPVSELATARASIAQAEGVGALQTSPVELRQARATMERAEAASQKKEFAEAKRLAVQAEVEAEVAGGRAKAAKALTAAAELQRSNQTLQQEIERKQ